MTTTTTRTFGGWILEGAAVVDRVLTWGIDPEIRDDLLMERAADRFDHIADPDASLASVLTRSIKSAFADLAYRFLGGEVSAVPVAILFAIIGLGSMADTMTSHLPAVVNGFNLLTGAGFLVLAMGGLAHPRELRRRWLLPGAVLVSIGAMAGAVMFPIENGSVMFDWLTRMALAGGGLGFALIAGSLMMPVPSRKWYRRGGLFIWGSGLFLGVGLLGLAVLAEPVYSTRASTFIIAIASIVGTALLGRLRFVPVAS